VTATSFELWAPFLVAFVIALAVTPYCIWVAPKIGAIDIPKDDRRVHTKAMPRFGGLAIYLAGALSMVLFISEEDGVPGALIGCTMIYILGVWDDLKELKALHKLLGQIACATMAFACGLKIEFVTNYLGDGNMVFGTAACYVVTVIWLVGITNAMNLIDGLDGLAAGISAISALCIAFVAYIHGQYVTTIAMMIIAGAALGFLPYNFHPAKIFMGDGGSQLLGFGIAAFSILGTVKSTTIIILIIPAVVLGIPIFDTAFAIIRRVVRRQPIGMGDKEHLHHRIMRAGFGQKRSVMMLYCISAIMGIISTLFSRGQFLRVETIGLTAVVVMLLYIFLSDTSGRNVHERGQRIKEKKEKSQ